MNHTSLREEWISHNEKKIWKAGRKLAGAYKSVLNDDADWWISKLSEQEARHQEEMKKLKNECLEDAYDNGIQDGQMEATKKYREQHQSEAISKFWEEKIEQALAEQREEIVEKIKSHKKDIEFLLNQTVTQRSPENVSICKSQINAMTDIIASITKETL